MKQIRKQKQKTRRPEVEPEWVAEPRRIVYDDVTAFLARLDAELADG